MHRTTDRQRNIQIDRQSNMKAIPLVRRKPYDRERDFENRFTVKFIKILQTMADEI